MHKESAVRQHAAAIIDVVHSFRQINAIPTADLVRLSFERVLGNLKEMLIGSAPIRMDDFLRAIAEGWDCDGAFYCRLVDAMARVEEGWFSGPLRFRKGEELMLPENMRERIESQRPYTTTDSSLLGSLVERGVRSTCAVPCELGDSSGMVALLNGKPKGDFAVIFTTIDETWLWVLVRLTFQSIERLPEDIAEEVKGKVSENLDLEAERESAWQTYLQHEQELLRDHYGEYVWVVPGEIRAVCPTQEELCKVLVEQKSQGRGIAFRIDEREAPVIPMSSPEIKFDKE
jgi:hypothetical protein